MQRKEPDTPKPHRALRVLNSMTESFVMNKQNSQMKRDILGLSNQVGYLFPSTKRKSPNITRSNAMK
jgi:hypothetical protein